MVSALDVARQFVILAARDGELMDQMRLYKLMYYAQGWSLAWYLEPLFDDQIKAWKQGPVPASVRRKLKYHAGHPIPNLGRPEALTTRERDLIQAVWEKYRKHSSWGLSALTHGEPPWKDAYRPDAPGRCGNVITNEALLDYFGRLYEEDTGEPPGSEAKIERQHAAGELIPLEEALARLAAK